MTKSLLRRNCTFTKNDDTPTSGGNPPEMADPAERQESQAVLQSADPGIRSGDSGLGRPHRKAEAVPADLQLTLRDRAEIEKTREHDTEIWASSFEMPKFISKFVKYMLLFLVSAAAFFTISQTAAFLANVRSLSVYEQIVLALPLILFGSILIWIIVKILLLLKRLHVSPQIQIKTLQELENRRELRHLCLNSKVLAREKLRDFLAFYESGCVDQLQRLNIGADRIRDLKRECQTLNEAGENLKTTTADWLRDVKNKFQSRLDDIAQERILKYSFNTGIMTGISPFPLVDRLIVLTNCIAMLKELLQIYGLRPAWDKSLILISQVICNTYLAGIADTAAERGAEQIAESVESITEYVPELALKFAGKTAAAATQGYMVYRLGKTAQKLLQPIK